jgi:GntR family transcriptional repressor for pyruvate dehydrogenase complex
MVRPSDQRPGPSVDWTGGGVRSASVASLVEARIEELIRRGDLADGSRLPPERDLAGLFGVSRTSVREAVRELWLKGLVDRRQGRGTFVRAGAGGRGAFLLRLRGRTSDAELTLLNVLDYRAALEPSIAARAAERARPADTVQLEAILSAMEATTNAGRTAELDAEFHYGVARATHNPLLVEVVEFSTTWLVATRQSGLQGRHRRALSRASHRALLRAIVAHDPEAAFAAMAQHIREVAEFVDSRLQNLVPPTAAGQRPGGTSTPRPRRLGAPR